MSELDFFQQTSIRLIDNEVYVNRNQLQELYGAAKKTLADNINQLKEDGLVVGAKIRPNSGKSYEVYNLDEIIAIGLRLRSDRAIEFQKWAIAKLKEEIISHKIKIQEVKEETRQAQIMESIAWNHLDATDNHR